MNKLQTAVVVALLAVLSVIAFDLHRLATVIAGPVLGRSDRVTLTARPAETDAEHAARLKREAAKLNQMVDDQAEILRLSLEADAKNAPAKHQPNASR